MTEKLGGRGSSRLGFETLEHRWMLAAVALFERTDGDVFADGQVSVGIPGGFSDVVPDSDAGNPPAETYANVSAEATASEIDGRYAHGEMELITVHNTPIGDTTAHMRGANLAVFQAEAIDGGSTVEIEGQGQSLGTYNLIELPDDEFPVYHGYWHVKSTGTGPEVGGGIVEVVTNHYAAITTGSEVWYVRASSTRPQDPQIGPYHAQWWVTYHLPDRADDAFLVTGSLDLDYRVEWPYGDEVAFEIASTLEIGGEGGSFALAPTNGDEAEFAWGTLTIAALSLTNVDAEYIPGGNESPFPELLPPKVSNVIISSTVSNSYGSNPPYDFDAAGADGSKEQLRTVRVGGANKIAVQFTEDVEIVSDDLDLIALNRVVSEPGVSSFVAPSSGNNYTATWTLTAPLPGAQYLLRLKDTILDLQGDALDGEWSNPGSITSNVTTTVFPSGDNFEGGDFEFVFTILPGDANRDNTVGPGDFSALQNNYNGTNKMWLHGDFNGDGTVGPGDYSLLQNHYNFTFQTLTILGDYDLDYDVDDDSSGDVSDDEDVFLGYYNQTPKHISADLDKSGVVNSADYDAFYELLGFGIDLRVLT